MTEGEGWHEFDAVVEVMPWGRNVYTVIRLDDALVAAARRLGTRRVEGTIESLEVNVGINRADVSPDAFMYAGKALLRRLEAAAGDVVGCRLRPADPDDVPVPDDVHRALVEAGLLEVFTAQPAVRRRRLLQPVEDAVAPSTRERRIAALVDAL